MKRSHPTYGPVAFRDVTTDTVIITGSTLVATEGLPMLEADGMTYPMVDVDVSSGSHPFWTGRRRPLDTEGRIEAFERRYGGAAESH